MREIEFTDCHQAAIRQNPLIFCFVEIQVSKWLDFKTSSLQTNVTSLRTNMTMVESCSHLWSSNLFGYVVTIDSIAF